MADKTLSLVADIILIFYQAFIFMKLFNWFVTEALQLDFIGFGLAFGLILLVGLLRNSTIDDSSYHYKKHNISEEELQVFGLTKKIAKIVVLTVILTVGFVTKTLI